MHSWRVWVLAHAELGAAVFHCFFSLFLPDGYFSLDFLSTISYFVCKHFVKMHLSLARLHPTTEPGGVPDVRKTAKAREAITGANSFPSHQRCSLCSPGAHQATDVLEKGRQC